MANNFPALPVVSTAGLTYSVFVGGQAGSYCNFPGQTFVPLSVVFTRTDPATQAVTYVYTGFDQGAYEVTLRAFLDGLCATLAANLAVATGQVQGAVVITRIWEYAVPGGGVFTVNDLTMTYP